jgi:taurine--2-oxoglutarate transaminase
MIPPAGYLRRVREICAARDVLLIHDEILTGLGRAGWPLAADAFRGARADITVLSKGLAAGYAAISAVVLAPHVAEAIRTLPLPIAGTMAGAPIAATAALAVQKVLDEIGVFDRTLERGSDFGRRLRKLERMSAVRAVRGMGYFYGVELREGVLARFLALGRAQGLIMYPFNGFRPNGKGEGVIVAPPLTASPTELRWLLDRLRAACEAVGDGVP